MSKLENNEVYSAVISPLLRMLDLSERDYALIRNFCGKEDAYTIKTILEDIAIYEARKSRK